MRTNLRNALLAAGAKALPLPPETAAFIALGVLDRLEQRPGRVTSVSVLLADGGEVGVAPSAAKAPAAEAADGVRRLLGEMLATAVAPPDALRAIAAQEPADLAGLRRDIETAVAPLSKPIARRILDRWLRDALRGVPASQVVVEPEASMGEPSAMEAILEDLSVPFIVPSEPPPGAPSRSSIDPSVEVRFGDAEAPPRRTHHLLLASITLLVLGLAGVVFVARPDILEDLAGTREPETTRPATAAPPAVVRGTLTVAAEPADAEVLFYVGRGPIDVDGLPPAPVEIVVRDEEGRTVRAAVPADQTEVAVQVPEEPVRAQAALPTTVVPGDAPPLSRAGRTAHVVTNPAGARVYLRVANVVPDLDVATAHELLVASEGHVPARVVVAPSDWATDGDGVRTAKANVTLDPAPRRRRR